ncbi:VirK/YbjX family protein [Necropsobacter massiliensis]|uniref:VirK/YbjX family protein n=1 Tax=Necropsobacter massiliensis TaxID=1400001 RepID=UPI001FEA6131|nr:DUF535 family protein [Necropsobacter massiliensis]
MFVLMVYHMYKLSHFPTFAEMYPAEKRWQKKLRSYLRYRFYTLIYARYCRELMYFLHLHPLWETLFARLPYRINTLLAKYCDKRFGIRRRFGAITANFMLAEQKFSYAKAQSLIQEESLRLATLTEALDLYLNINKIDPFEGFFSLNIINSHKESMYDASFAFLPPNTLLITSIQGPHGAQAQSLIRETTKNLHGMRPMFMLINAFQLLSETLNCELCGIPHKNQAKYRWNDSTKLLFNYDEFWRENGGVYDKSRGYWLLPRNLERKCPTMIPSKKRSMYRKRYAMLDHTAQQIKAFFATETC